MPVDNCVLAILSALTLFLLNEGCCNDGFRKLNDGCCSYWIVRLQSLWLPYCCLNSQLMLLTRFTG